MYRTGHYGMALLVYAPLGAVVLGAGYEELAVLGAVGALVLTPVPDYDLRVPFLEHRGPTHTVGFALLVAAITGGATGFVARGRYGSGSATVALAGFGALVGIVAIGAHLLADVLTPAGIEPFWPVSNRSYTLGVATADNAIANYALLALGVFVTVSLGLVAARL